jgi:hypothetical protein
MRDGLFLVSLMNTNTLNQASRNNAHQNLTTKLVRLFSSVETISNHLKAEQN